MKLLPSSQYTSVKSLAHVKSNLVTCVKITFKDELTPVLSYNRGEDGAPFTTVIFTKAFDPGCFKRFNQYSEINHIKAAFIHKKFYCLTFYLIGLEVPDEIKVVL